MSTYLDAMRDAEAGRYRILAGLRRISSQFRRNRLFPELSELVGLIDSLDQILSESAGLEGSSRRLVGIDLESNRLIYDRASDSDAFEQLAETIRWSLPMLREQVDEGRTIHSFVEKYSRLDEVGLVPRYLDEGYLIVPDLLAGKLHVLRYEMSKFARAGEKFRSLRTETIRTIDLNGSEINTWQLKRALVADRQDLPNPATWRMATDIAVPYSQTLLPMAKRALLRRIAVRPS